MLSTPSPVLAAQPENIALRATAIANSEYNSRYAARFAIDGHIPGAGTQNDAGKAWCVRGDTHRHGAEFTLTWPEPVRVAEIVYYGRTAWYAEECWKDYEVYAGDAPKPVVRGRFQRGHGPQPITLDPPRTVQKLRLHFTSSYGGPNPGASEIQVYSETLPADALKKFRPLPPGRPVPVPDEEVPESPALAARVQAGALGFDKLLVIQRHPIQPSHVYTYHVEGFRAGGGLFVYSIKDRSLRPLVLSPQGQILDCDLSFDGRRVLFSWRRSKQEGYQVFAVGVDGAGLRQLTEGPHHNYNACWLPDGDVAFLSTRAARFAYCWVSPVGVLHRMEADGSHVERLSANIVNDFTPSVMNDGRILYSRWEYVDKPAIPIQSLWAIRPDGTGLAAVYGNRVLSPATFMEARTIPGDGRLLCTLTSHNGPARGAIGIVDRGNGNNIRGPYQNPYPIDDRYFLASRTGTVILRDYAGTELVTLLEPRDGMGFFCPQPIRPRPRPPVLAPARPPKAEGRWATVVLQDVYQGLEPHVKRGEVRRIAVVEEMTKEVRTDVANRAFGFQFPVISCGATYAGKKVWGFAPVTEDGSACFQVPAGRPIYFLALDEHGRAVQRMRSFTHLMPGEVQGCIGCHEPRRHAPSAILKAQVLREPDPLEPPEWGQGVGFDYTRLIQPIWDRHCLDCHSGVEPAGGLDLCGDKTDFFNVSYDMLARGRRRAGEAEWDSPYVNWIPTYNGMESNILEITPKAWGSFQSRLADLLLKGHQDSTGRPRVQLSRHELQRVFLWIDLNVPYYGTSETAYPEARGCRRLYPPELDRTLAEVAARRCASCHENGRIPRPFWTRITHPERNGFLLAPLAREAGGSQRCGQPVFATTSDPDYQAILRTFEPVLEELRRRPRMDCAGARPADVDRSCLGSL